MTEQLKDLIQKIQDEGVKAAQEKARAIEEEAKRNADEIIKKAKDEASRIIASANDAAQKKDASTKASLEQAARDMILALRQEISNILNKIISANVRHALSPQELITILDQLVKDSLAAEEGRIIVSMKKEDKDKLESSFASELKELIKHGIVLKSSKDITGGFTISYDAGRS
ncbi:MAG TPA: V-type ATP synthase subunit E family protein, partial [Candidatus Omnitrophota bacterium]|nr:V-type ATP synthase subunit E family protein [Candidatus Omnitrophota bacterium]